MHDPESKTRVTIVSVVAENGERFSQRTLPRRIHRGTRPYMSTGSIRVCSAIFGLSLESQDLIRAGHKSPGGSHYQLDFPKPQNDNFHGGRGRRQHPRGTPAQSYSGLVEAKK